MTSPPRWRHELEALAQAAALMRDARAGKDDADAWAMLAADWEWVISHQRPDAPRLPRQAIITALEAAIARDSKALLSGGVTRRSTANLGPSDQLPEATIARLEKLELIETLLWHERHLLAGRPTILFCTQFNIDRGVAPRQPVGKPPPALATPSSPRSLDGFGSVQDGDHKCPPTGRAPGEGDATERPPQAHAQLGLL